MATRDMRGFSAEASADAVVYPLSASQRSQVREQLDRILASSLFRYSKRFPPFLRYTVNCVLENGAAHLKERTVGTEAFNREPSYDTNLDPIVRVTAAEVRKRLKQYYKEVGHEHELHIEFARGSYIPDIKFQADLASEGNTASFPPAAHPDKSTRQRLLIACLTAPYLVAICTALIAAPHQTALDRFLKPLTSSKSSVLICVPDPDSPSTSSSQASQANNPDGSPAAQAGGVSNPDRASFADSLVLASLANALGRKGTELRVRHTQEADLDDLKDGPVILIGGFSNRWTMRLDSGLRFSLMREGPLRYIADRRNPSFRDWAISIPPAPSQAPADYALISRVLDVNTGRVLLTVAGIHHLGTESAAECFTDSRCFDAAERMAPGDWQRANIQVVLRTTVIGNNAGRPTVLAATVW